MKNSATIVIAVVMVCLSAALYLSAAPEKAGSAAEEVTNEAPIAPPAPVVYIRKGEMPPGPVVKLKKGAPCLGVEGDRYKGGEAAAFKTAPREGVTVFNGCTAEIVITDVKANATSLAYTSSLFPARAVLRGRAAKQEKDLLIALTREGVRCDKEGPEGRLCRFISLPPGRNMFFSVPHKQWFSIRLQDGRRIEGYLLEPFDPKAPKKRETVKMPEKGFTFKRQE